MTDSVSVPSRGMGGFLQDGQKHYVTEVLVFPSPLEV